jgi:hypothetical protein
VSRLKTPSPYVTTLSGVLTYHFDASNTLSLSPILPGLSTIRRIRGLYLPALTNQNVSDYGYQNYRPFNQDLPEKRLYEGAVDIDNENRLVVFRADPGATSTKWKLDFYPKAPTLTEDSDIPILPGWEMSLIFVGMRAFAEEWKSGSSETWRPLFEQRITQYTAVLGNDAGIPRLDENGYIHQDPVVGAQ